MLNEILNSLKCDDKLTNYARNLFSDSIKLKEEILKGQYLEQLVSMAKTIATAFQQGKKLLLCGNGGSAADAQHLAAELLVRLRSQVNRASLPAIALAMDT